MFAVGGIDNGSACPTCKVRWLERELTVSGAQWTWKDFQLGNTTQLLACYAESPERTWFTGNDSKFVHRVDGVPSAGDFGGGQFFGSYSGAWGNADAGYFFTRREGREVTRSADGVSGFVQADVGAQSPLRSVWGLGPGDVFAVGLLGETSHFDGVTWTQWTLPSQPDFAAVHGAIAVDGTRRYVAVGNGGTLYSVVGDAGVVSEVSPAVSFNAAWVSTHGMAWAAGKASDGGAFVMRGEAGGAWAFVPLSSPRPVTGVFGFDRKDGGTTVWVTGPVGMVLRKEE